MFGPRGLPGTLPGKAQISIEMLTNALRTTKIFNPDFEKCHSEANYFQSRSPEMFFGSHIVGSPCVRPVLCTCGIQVIRFTDFLHCSFLRVARRETPNAVPCDVNRSILPILLYRLRSALHACLLEEGAIGFMMDVRALPR